MANAPLSPLDKVLSEAKPQGLGLPNFQPTERAPAAATEPVDPGQLRGIFESAAIKYNVPVNVLLALGDQESSFNPRALGQQTKWGQAKGIMQYLDSTAKNLGINAYDPEQSVNAAAMQIRERLDKGYSMEDAIKEHFAGPDRRQWGKKTARYGMEVVAKARAYADLYPEQQAEPAAAPQPEQQGAGERLMQTATQDQLKAAQDSLRQQPPSPLTIENQQRAAAPEAAPSPLTIVNQRRVESGMPPKDTREYQGFIDATGAALSNVPERFQQSIAGLIQMAGEDLNQERERFIADRAQAYGITPGDMKLLAWAGNEGLIDPKTPIPEALKSVKQNIAQSLNEQQLKQLDAAGIINPAEISAFAKDWRAQTQKTMAEVRAEPGSAAYYGSAAIGSLAEMGPMLAAAIATRNPTIATAIMGGQVGGQAYATGRERGLTEDQAQTYALLTAAAEAAPEALVVGRLLKAGTGGIIKKALEGSVLEGSQEAVTAALQAGIDKGFISPDMTLKEALVQVRDGAIVGALVGGGMGATIAGADSALGRNRQPAQPQERIEPTISEDGATPTAQPAATTPAAQSATTPAAEAPESVAPAPVQADQASAQQQNPLAGMDTSGNSLIQPAPQPAPSGPLGRALQNAMPGRAEESAADAQRVTLSAEGLEPISGAIVSETADSVLIRGDDGQSYEITRDEIANGQAIIQPEGQQVAQQEQPAEQPAAEQPAAEQVPMATDALSEESINLLRQAGVTDEQLASMTAEEGQIALDRLGAAVPAAETPEAETATQEQAATAEQPAAEKPAEQKPVEPVVNAPKREEPKSYEEMTEPELRDRLKYLGGQAKATGGWNKMLMQERRKVEQAIEAKKVEPTNSLQGEPASWVIRDKATGEVVMETFDRKKVDALNTENYEAVPVQQHLGELNQQIKAAAPTNRAAATDAGAQAFAAGAERTAPDMKPGLQEAWLKGWDKAKAAAPSVSAAQTPAAQPQQAAPSIAGRDIDGDWAKFAKRSGTLNVPRAEMPQIKAEHRGAMTQFLNARGIAHQEETVPAASLKPTQAEFSREKVAKAKAFDGGDRSILVSSDNHVLDGHHQWLAKREAGEDVKIIRLDAPIRELLKAAHEFPSSTVDEGAAAPAEQKAESEKPAAKPKTGGTISLSEIKAGDQFQSVKYGNIAPTGGTIEKAGRANIVFGSDYMGKPITGVKLPRAALAGGKIVRDGVVYDVAAKDAKPAAKKPAKPKAKKPQQEGGEPRYSLGDDRNLMAIHNLSADNLAFADRMGGIAVPSIGVVTRDAGGVDGFGEITLIGTRNLADPKREPVFSADAYTARFPKPEFRKAKAKDADAVLRPLKSIADEFGDVRVTETAFDYMVNDGDGSRAIDELMNSPAARAMFLREKGHDIKPVMRDATLESPFTPAQILGMEKLIRSADKAARLDENDDPDVKEVERLLAEAIDKKHAKRPTLAAKMKERMMGQPGWAAFTLMSDLQTAKRGPAVDTWETRTKTLRAIEENGLEMDFKRWVEGKILPVMGEPMLTVGRRKVPYTLDNIVEVMTRGPVRGQEKTMVFGTGQARAASSVEFSDIEQMREAAKRSIVDPQAYEEAKKTSEKLLEQYRDAVIEFTTIRNWQGRPDTFEALDSSMRAIAKFSTKKKRDRAAMEAALKSENFDVAAMKAAASGGAGAVNRAAVQEIEAEIQKWADRLQKLEPGDSRIPEVERRLKQNQDALQQELAKAADQTKRDPIGLAMLAAEGLLNAPVPYFEAKPQRAVQLSEFAGAVVPKGLPADARAILEKAGLPVIEYGSEGERMAAVRDAANKLATERDDVLFSLARDGDTAVAGDERFSLRQGGMSALMSSDPVELETPTELKGLSLEQQREKVYDDMLGRRGLAVVHPEIGPILTNRAGITKSRSSSNDPAKVATLPLLRSLVPDMHYLGSKEDVGNKYHYLGARVRLDGKPMTMLVTLRDQGGKTTYYNHTMLNDVREPANDNYQRPSLRVERMSLSAPATGEQIREALASGPAGKQLQQLMDAGKIVVHDTMATVPGKTMAGMMAKTEADGVVHVVAENIDPRNASAVLLHEMFHSGGQALAGTRRWAQLMVRLEQLYKQYERSNGKARDFFNAARGRVDKARARMDSAGQPMSDLLQVEEFGAYAIEEYERAPGAVRKWVDDLVGAIKDYLFRRFGMQLGKVTPAQLRAMAVAAVRSQAPRAGTAASMTEQTETPAFKRWFGDSKVVDADGKPLVVYHGTRGDFDAFDTVSGRDLGSHFGTTKGQANDFVKDGGQIMPVYLKVTNPLRLTDLERWTWAELQPALRDRGIQVGEVEYRPETASPKENNVRMIRRQREEIIRALSQAGYDGIVYKNEFEGDGKSDAYIVFNPEQIKSAIGNRGTFDPASPDIRMSMDGARANAALQPVPTASGAPAFRSDDGVVLYGGRKHSDSQGDLDNRERLPYGHRAHVTEGNSVWDFKAFKNGEHIANVTLQLDQQGNIDALHDIKAITRRRGAGEAVVASILAASRKPLRIIQAVPTAKDFWSKMGANGYFDLYDNTTIDWSSYAENRRGRGQQVQSAGAVRRELPADGQGAAAGQAEAAGAGGLAPLDQESLDYLSNPDLWTVKPDGPRYSLSDIPNDAPTEKQVDSWFSQKLTDAMTGPDSKGVVSLLAAAPMDRMVEELAADNQAAQEYLKLNRDMAAYRNKKYREYDDTAKRWLWLNTRNRKAASAMADIMHEATIAQTDPAAPFETSITKIDTQLAEYQPDSEAGKAAIQKIAEDKARKEAHAKLKARFDALPKSYQELYVTVRDSYKAMALELDEILAANLGMALDIGARKAERRFEKDMEVIRDEGLQGEERDEAIRLATSRYNAATTKQRWNKRARMTELRQQLEANRLKGPYFPLARFGEYFVTVRDKDSGEVISFNLFRTNREQQKFAKEAASIGKVTTGLLSNKDEVRGAVDPRFVTEIEEILAGSDVPDAVKDQVWQRYLETLPELSMRKGFIHRKARKGYSSDALRAFASRMFHGSYQMGRLKYGASMQEQLELAQEAAASSSTPERDTAVINELNRRHKFVMNPQGSAFAQRLTSAAFVWQLSMSPAAAIVNTSQTVIIGMPVISAEFGTSMATVGAELTKASRDFITGKGYAEKSSFMSADERAAMQAGYDTGVIDATQTHDLAGVGETGVEYSPVRDVVMGVVGWQFHQAERFNREVTYLSIYRMARKKGQDHQRAIETAGRLTYKVHFDYSGANRPRFMQNDFAKVALVFRNYSVNMLFRLFRDVHQVIGAKDRRARTMAIKQLAGITGMMAVSAGVRGTWMYGVAMVLASMLFGDDAEDQFKKGTVELLGPTMAGFLLNGLPGHATGVALSERIGMPDLWFRSPDRQLEGKDEFNYWFMQAAGAFPSLLGNVWTGFDMMFDGHVFRGVETASPKFVKDIMRASRYAYEGATTLRGDKIVDELTTKEIITQALGFTPAVVAEQYERNSALMNAQQRIRDERATIMKGMIEAAKDGDQGKMAEFREAIQEFNAKNPEVPITGDALARSAKSRARYSSRAEGGVALDARLDRRLRDSIGPAIYK